MNDEALLGVEALVLRWTDSDTLAISISARSN